MALLAALSAACRDKPKPSAGDSKPEATGAAVEAAAPIHDAAPSDDALVVDESAGSALVYRWLIAQNNGDFEAYRGLYAEDFTGVLRTGEHTKELDHDTWLASRERMFKKPMTVAAESLEVTRDGNRLTAHFTQRWTSGKYQDYGPKTLELAARDGALRIVREEMRESHTVMHRSRFAFVFNGYGLAGPVDRVADKEMYGAARYRDWDVADVHYVMIEPHASPLAAKGKARYLWKGASKRAAIRGAKREALSEQAAAWQGKTVTLITDQGETCPARIRTLEILGHDGYSPPSPSLGYESDEWDDLPPPPTASEFWTDARYKRLVGRVVFDSDTCAGAVVAARAQRGKLPRLLSLVQQDPDLANDPHVELIAAAKTYMVGLPGWRALNEVDQFILPADPHTPDFRVVGLLSAGPDDPIEYVAISAALTLICEHANYWVILKILGEEAEPRFSVVAEASMESAGDPPIAAPDPTEIDQRAAFTPVLAADFDGDGHIEFVSDRLLLRWDGVEYRFTQGGHVEPEEYLCGD
ncbi:nuclear transport factor 2 family protein [Haliangium sp.]|uniref:nuclear transport factor 2 family protein n=1 Tax=Haliangium sp. TaxID=2663208 RepID=UPI003D10537D